jgi:hypothetical protein
MSRRALVAFAAVFAIGLAGLLLTAAVERKSDAFTLGVLPAAGIARLGPDHELCQRPIDVIESFERVTVQLGTFGRPGQPFALEVRDAGSDRPIVGARVDGGYADNSVQTVTLSRAVHEGPRVAVCVRNLGKRAIAPYGNSGLSNRTSAAYLDGRRIDGDVTLTFVRAKPARVLGLVPSIVERASLFHGGWATQASYWVLLVLLLAGPASLAALAVRAAFRDAT